jgi:hypothetical protein
MFAPFTQDSDAPWLRLNQLPTIHGHYDLKKAFFPIAALTVCGLDTPNTCSRTVLSGSRKIYTQFDNCTWRSRPDINSTLKTLDVGIEQGRKLSVLVSLRDHDLGVTSHESPSRPWHRSNVLYRPRLREALTWQNQGVIRNGDIVEKHHPIVRKGNPLKYQVPAVIACTCIHPKSHKPRSGHLKASSQAVERHDSGVEDITTAQAI